MDEAYRYMAHSCVDEAYRSTARDPGGCIDERRSRYYSEIVNMFDLLAAMLHKYVCASRGVKDLTQHDADKLEDDLSELQLRMVQGGILVQVCC